MKEQTNVYFPNLDGLRFFAFLLVFVNHTVICLGFTYPNSHYIFIRENFLKNGDMGVSFFFVLSGFLITYLLLKEKEENNRISIKNFYARRVLRIFPLYYLVVIITLFIIPIVKNHVPMNFPMNISTSTLSPWYYFTFTGNFDFMKNGISNVILSVLWSVSVEEQFYLFWPLIVAFIPKKYLIHSFALVIIASIGFRYFYTDGRGMLLKFHSLSCMTYLAMGAIMAYLATSEKVVSLIKRIPRWMIVLVYVVGISCIPLRLYIWKFGAHYVLVASFVPVVLALFFSFIIMEQCFSEKSFYKMSRLTFISSMGKYTYGMYCYHMIVFFALLFGLHLTGVELSQLNKSAFVAMVITAFAGTCFVSVVSYHYFEMLFLKLKKRF